MNAVMKDLGMNPLNYVLENSLVDHEGIWAEFGVFSGKTINLISKFTKNKVYGFDTFSGLPESWDVAPNLTINSGFYSYKDFSRQNGAESKFPPVRDNVVLVEGLFSETLPGYFTERVTLMHVDCDTYGSTVDIFKHLSSNIIPGCIIVFDEFINYPNYDKHEYKAFMEWVKEQAIEFEYVGINGIFDEAPKMIYDKMHQKAAVRILKNPSCTVA